MKDEYLKHSEIKISPFITEILTKELPSLHMGFSICCENNTSEMWGSFSGFLRILCHKDKCKLIKCYEELICSCRHQENMFNHTAIIKNILKEKCSRGHF